MGHIFISYSHKDTDYAHGLANNLQNIGFEIWIDERLDYGSQWPLEIQKQLDSCDAFIIIMTPRSYASEWVQSELQRAKRKLKPIFPLLLEGDEPWLSIESTQFYDVRGAKFPDAKFYSALKRVAFTSPTARTFPTLRESKKTEPVAGPPAPKRMTGVAIAAIGGVIFICAACIVSIGLFGSSFMDRLVPVPVPTTVTFALDPSPTAGSTEMPTTDIPLVSQPSSMPEITYTQTSIPPTVTSVPPTSTSIPPTATPKRNTSIYIEAENGNLGNGAYVENNSTASKNSFVNFSGAGTLKFTLGNMRAGQYSLVIHYIKYANGNEYPNTGFQNLYVNNDPDPISIYYTKTFGDGDVLTWNDTSLTISLEDGTNTLLISVIPGSIGASVDYIYVSIIN